MNSSGMLNATDTGNETFYCPPYHITVTQVLVPTLFAVIVLIGLVGNSLVCVVIFMHRQMQTSTNVLILGLAIADISFLLACVPPTAIEYMLSTFIFPGWWCKVLNYLQHLFAYTTVWTLVLMATDRFCAVVLPIWSMKVRTNRNTAFVLAGLWVFTIIGCLPIAFQYRLFAWQDCHQNDIYQCIPKNVAHPDKATEVFLFYLSFNVFSLLLPLAIILVLYASMLKRLWVSTKPGANTGTYNAAVSQRERMAKKLKAKRRVTIVVMGVTLTFAVCWLPLNVGFFLMGLTNGLIFSENGDWFIPMAIAFQVLAYTNSCLNPILYAFLSEHFRNGFIEIARRCCGPRLEWLLPIQGRRRSAFDPDAQTNAAEVTAAARTCNEPPSHRQRLTQQAPTDKHRPSDATRYTLVEQQQHELHTIADSGQHNSNVVVVKYVNNNSDDSYEQL